MKKFTDEVRKKLIEYAKNAINEDYELNIKRIENNIYHIERIDKYILSEMVGHSGPEGGYKNTECLDLFYDFNIKYTGTQEELRDFILSLNGTNGDISKLNDVTDYAEDYKQFSETEEF